MDDFILLKQYKKSSSIKSNATIDNKLDRVCHEEFNQHILVIFNQFSMFFV